MCKPPCKSYAAYQHLLGLQPKKPRKQEHRLQNQKLVQPNGSARWHRWAATTWQMSCFLTSDVLDLSTYSWVACQLTPPTTRDSQSLSYRTETATNILTAHMWAMWYTLYFLMFLQQGPFHGCCFFKGIPGNPKSASCPLQVNSPATYRSQRYVSTAILGRWDLIGLHLGAGHLAHVHHSLHTL